MEAKGPEGPALSRQRPPVLACAASAQIKLADPVDSVRRADCGPAPITRLVHLLPPASPRDCTDCTPLHRCSPSRPFKRPGTTARIRAVAQRRSPSPRLGGALRRPAATRASAESSLSIQSGRLPCQIQEARWQGQLMTVAEGKPRGCPVKGRPDAAPRGGVARCGIHRVVRGCVRE